MTHPGLFESDPFLLPGHFLVGAVRDVPEHCEIVGKAFGKTIIRSPKLSFALETACPPSVPDVIKTINADHVEIDKITDPQKLHIVAERALANLAMLARAGNGKALWHFASLTSRCCSGLSEMTRSSPEAMRPIARLCAQWPMMRSTHPRNCDPDSLLEQIELAKGVSVQMDKYSKWKPGFASTYAVRLYEHLHGVRNDNPRIHSPNRKAAHLKDLLPEFNKDNSNQWWQWAEAFFLATYPEPQNIPELAALVADPKKRRTPGRLKQAIKDKIKAAFLALPLPELKPLNG